MVGLAWAQARVWLRLGSARLWLDRSGAVGSDRTNQNRVGAGCRKLTGEIGRRRCRGCARGSPCLPGLADGTGGCGRLRAASSSLRRFLSGPVAAAGWSSRDGAAMEAEEKRGGGVLGVAGRRKRAWTRGRPLLCTHAEVKGAGAACFAAGARTSGLPTSRLASAWAPPVSVRERREGASGLACWL